MAEQVGRMVFDPATAAEVFGGPGRTVQVEVDGRAGSQYVRRGAKIRVNGWTFSVIWGYGSYSTAARMGWVEGGFDVPIPECSPDAEIACWKGDGGMINLHGDTVEGWVAPASLLAALVAAEADDIDAIRAALVRTDETGGE